MFLKYSHSQHTLLENNKENLLKELEEYDVTLDDLYRIRDFLKVCAENDYILGTWW